jgi:hypothetical protein
MSKVLYIEKKPVKQELKFESREEFREWHNKRIQEICNFIYSNENSKSIKPVAYSEYYEYKMILLNKNGTPRKIIEKPVWLYSKKAKKKQRKNWLKYIEKRKEKTRQRTQVRKEADLWQKIVFAIKEWQEFSKKDFLKKWKKKQ